MTVTNVIEVVVALALLYAAYRFFPEAGMTSHEGQTYPGRSATGQRSGPG
jgi:hypothetical protein